MHTTTSFSLVLVTFLKLTIVSSSPTPYPQIQTNSTISAPYPQNQTNSTIPAPYPQNQTNSTTPVPYEQIKINTNTQTQLIVKHINCIDFKTPYSCDNFCFATFCLGYPDILHHETDKKAQNKNRDASGANLQPFQDKNIQKYGLTRKNADAIIADEYPLASSLEGGLGIGTGNQRAVIMGATKDDQQGQSNWARKLWTNPTIPQAAAIQIVLDDWDPKLSPYCEAKKNRDTSACHNPKSFIYRRQDKNNGPNGRASFDHVGT